MILQEDMSFICFAEAWVDVIFAFADQLAVFFTAPLIFKHFEPVQPVFYMSVERHYMPGVPLTYCR